MSLVRTIALKNALSTAQTQPGSGTAFDLGTVASGEKLYGVLHVTGRGGTTGTLVAEIQSATSSGFTSPNTRITFAAATDRSAEWANPISGPIADHQFWRANWFVSSSGGATNFNFLETMGIQ